MAPVSLLDQEPLLHPGRFTAGTTESRASWSSSATTSPPQPRAERAGPVGDACTTASRPIEPTVSGRLLRRGRCLHGRGLFGGQGPSLRVLPVVGDLLLQRPADLRLL